MTPKKPPFLTIVTRCCRRPKMLGLCIRSVLAQTDRDVEQIFIVDTEKRGLIWANQQFHTNRHRINGRYVYMLDDDDALLDPELVAKLKTIAVRHNDPEVILVRALIALRRKRLNRSNHVETPPAHVWDLDWEHGRRPRQWIGSGTAIVVRSDVWRSHTRAYFTGMGEHWKTGGDWHFMTRIIETGAKIVRLNTVASKCLQRGMGKKFEGDCPPDWWRHTVTRFSIEEVVPGDWQLRHYLKCHPDEIVLKPKSTPRCRRVTPACASRGRELVAESTLTPRRRRTAK